MPAACTIGYADCADCADQLGYADCPDGSRGWHVRLGQHMEPGPTVPSLTWRGLGRPRRPMPSQAKPDQAKPCADRADLAGRHYNRKRQASPAYCPWEHVPRPAPTLAFLSRFPLPARSPSTALSSPLSPSALRLARPSLPSHLSSSPRFPPRSPPASTPPLGLV